MTDRELMAWEKEAAGKPDELSRLMGEADRLVAAVSDESQWTRQKKDMQKMQLTFLLRRFEHFRGELKELGDKLEAGGDRSAVTRELLLQLDATSVIVTERLERLLESVDMADDAFLLGEEAKRMELEEKLKAALSGGKE